MESFAQIWWSSCFVLFSSLRDTSLHFNSSHYLISSRHNCPLNPPQTHSKLQQPASQLLDYCHSTISSGKACHSRIILSAPLSSVRRCPGSQRHSMAAAPVRQRSGSAGPRTQLPPCYYEGYLEKRGPTEKVGSPGAHPHSHARTHTIHTFQCHVVSAARVMNSGVGGQCVCASHDDLPFPESCQLPYCAQTVEAEGWRYREPCSVHMAAGRRSNRECSPCKEWQEKWVWVCPSSRSQRLTLACKSPTASRTSFEMKSWRRLCGSFLIWTWKSVYVQCVH